MLDKIKGRDKDRYTLYLPTELIRRIKQCALDRNQTQSKLVHDAVDFYLRVQETSPNVVDVV